jgi:sec-independent protein translocase protein TatB
MFDLGWDEMALIAVVTLIVIGPKDLPVVLRQAGRWARRARELAAEFQRGVDDMVRETELHEMKHQVEQVTDLRALEQKIESAVDPTGDIAQSLAPPAEPPPPELPPTAPFAPPSRPPEP